MRTGRLTLALAALFLAMFVTTSALGAQGRAARYERSLRWAERHLRRSSLRWAERLLASSPVPPVRAHPWGGRWQAEKAEGGFAAIIRKYGGSERAYLGLGRCQMRLGDYEPALRSFARARQLSPRGIAAQRSYVEARRLVLISRAVSSQLPRGQRVVQIGCVRTRRAIWAVLSADVESLDESQAFADPHLCLFEQTHAGYHKFWQTKPLCSTYGKGDDWRGYFNEVAFTVANLTGDGAPGVAVWEISAGGNWVTSHLDVFTLRGSQLVKLTGFSSRDLIWMEDLNHNGRDEIGTWRGIGWDMLHAGQPRWGDIYAWKKGRYVLADRDFPGQFRGTERELLEAAKEYPDDPEVREYLGIARDTERKPSAALAADRSAVLLYRKRSFEVDEPHLREKLRAIRRRMAADRGVIQRHSRGRA